MVLWDIEPAGDRIRCRFIHRGPRPLSTLSFLMDPELMIRSVDIPGLIDSSWAGTSEKPIWTARMDPPLQEGAVMALDLWRPAAPSKGGKGSRSKDDLPAAESTRRFPPIEPLGVERYSGLLGSRRPGHWTGRLQPPSGTESLSDESFVKSWGPLPDDRLTLSGTTRLVRDVFPSLQTGPAVARIKVKPVLELGIEPGRIDVRFDADLDDIAGSLNHLELAVPHDLVVLSVDSDALTDWSRPDPRRLLLRYDRPFSRTRRRLRIAGWIPVLEDPLEDRQPATGSAYPVAGGLGFGECFRHSDHRVDLQASGQQRTRPKVLTAAPTRATNGTDERTRLTYRVEDPAKLGFLQWSTAPPRSTS